MAPALVKRRAAIPFPDEGTLRLAVVADTHGRPHPRARELIAAGAPHAILHAGDIGELEVLDLLEEIAPVHAIRGNIDGHARDLPDALVLDVARPCGDLRLLLLHIAVAGPRLRADAARLARQEEAGMVVCGHSHVPFIGVDRGLAILNPGSIGPRRFTLPIVFARVDIPADGGIRPRHVSCETGEVWTPP